LAVMLSRVRQLHSYFPCTYLEILMLCSPSASQIQVDIDSVAGMAFSSLCRIVAINCVAGCWTWLCRYPEYGSHEDAFYSYFEMPL
jgi:hypothetical protein